MVVLEPKKPVSRRAGAVRPAHRYPGLPRLSFPVVQRTACACGGSCPRCQAKSNLKVGEPNDQYEREADRVADAVMRGRNTDPAHAVRPGIRAKLYRKVLRPEEKFDSLAPAEEVIGSAPSGAEPPEALQRTASGEAGAVTPQYERSLHQAVQRGGDVLPSATRLFMESRFGWDFSSVRVHSDPQAGSFAQEVNARAFTLGNDIFFGQSEYQPFTQEGQRLLAHELTHVVQQSDGRLSRQIQRTPGPTRCSSYPGYDASVDRYTYNCAGLALRTYRFTSPPSAVYSEMAAQFFNPVCPVGNCQGGQVKFWLWDYDIHTEDDLGNIVDPTWHDFHIVGGRMRADGSDPTDVYSKNGRRPIHGPGTGPSFRPASRDRALDNDDRPGTTASGRPLYKVRSSMREVISCAGCSG